MNSFKCGKCDETMTSKNPATRSVFPTDMTAAIMTNITNVITTKKEDGRRKVVIEFPFSDTNEDWSNDELEMECVKIIRELTDENVINWLCDHEWIKLTDNPDDYRQLKINVYKWNCTRYYRISIRGDRDGNGNRHDTFGGIKLRYNDRSRNDLGRQASKNGDEMEEQISTG